MKRLFALPVIGLVLGAVAIATEIKTGDLVPVGQQLSGVVVSCIKTALTTRENTIFSSYTVYQNESVTALAARKNALIAARDKPTKSEMKSAITVAWKAYKKSMKALKATMHSSTAAARSEYKTAVKTCNGTSLLRSIDTSSLHNEQ